MDFGREVPQRWLRSPFSGPYTVYMRNSFWGGGFVQKSLNFAQRVSTYTADREKETSAKNTSK